MDEGLLNKARIRRGGCTDSELFDAALQALLDRDQDAEIDADYERAYADQPIDTADVWGDLASFRTAITR